MSECAHKFLKKQMVGNQIWYRCECGQKFLVEPWDGRVRLVEGLKVEEGPQPWAYAYRYPDGIRVDTGGREINGCKPIEAIPLYLGTPAAQHLKREQEPASGESCPRCGGDITNEGGHGFWCRDEKCKWGWEIDAAQPPQELEGLRSLIVKWREKYEDMPLKQRKGDDWALIYHECADELEAALTRGEVDKPT